MYKNKNKNIRMDIRGMIPLMLVPYLIALVAGTIGIINLMAGDLHNGFILVGAACLAGGIGGTLNVGYYGLTVGGTSGVVLIVLGSFM